MTPTDPFFVIDQMPQFMQALLGYCRQWPIPTALFLMMFFDVMSGIAVAVMKKKLSSSVSWRGACKKVIMLLLTGVGAVLEPFSGGLPLYKLCCVFFLYNEALSVLENAAESGVPLPQALIDVLAKLRMDSINKKEIPYSPTITLPPSAEVKISPLDPPKTQ